MVALSNKNFAARAEFLHEIAQHSIGTIEGNRCLMIGSGTGHNTRIFGREFDQVDALDIVPRDFPSIVDNALVADGTALPYDSDTFDLCVAISVVEHILPPSNRENLIKEMIRCTAPGGHVFFQIPNKWFPIELHTGLPVIHWLPGGKRLAINQGYTTLKQVHIPSRQTLETWVRDAGADVIESRGIVYPAEAIPKYTETYELLKSIGMFNVFPFGYVVAAKV
jgi:SAM-dependent methyltransferase